MPIFIPKGSIMQWNSNAITEHNRSEISIDVERIEKSNRMANGMLRKWVVIDKRKFSCSWDMLPALTTKTVDGKWGGTAIETFYNTTPGVFTLIVQSSAGNQTYSVVFTGFDKTVVKRTGTTDLWDLSIEMEEV